MIRLAIVGAGHWGPNLIRNFHNYERSSVAWVIDKDTARLAGIAERYPGVATAGDLHCALGDPSVDAVVVATPTSTHYAIARAALEAGKHVLVEKPIATEVAHAEHLCELAARQQRVLMVGHVFVHNAGTQWVGEYLRAGELGRVYYVSMVRTNLGPVRGDVNAAWDLAAHDISIANYWLQAPALTASASGGAWINAGVEDAVFATLRYPDDVLVNLQVSWLNPRKARDITVVGSKRMLTFDDMNLLEPVRIYDKSVADEPTVIGFADTFASFRASVRDGSVTIPQVSLGEPLKTQCEHFLDCIANHRTPLNKRTPLTDGASGLAVVRALAAMARSMRHGGREERVE